jgi:hypothetical protein
LVVDREKGGMPKRLAWAHACGMFLITPVPCRVTFKIRLTTRMPKTDALLDAWHAPHLGWSDHVKAAEWVGIGTPLS